MTKVMLYFMFQITRCLVEVLSKALSKPDSLPLDQECKDILKAGKLMGWHQSHSFLENNKLAMYY